MVAVCSWSGLVCSWSWSGLVWSGRGRGCGRGRGRGRVEFLALDLDHNGMLSRHELLGYCRPNARLTPTFVERVFEETITYDTHDTTQHNTTQRDTTRRAKRYAARNDTDASSDPAAVTTVVGLAVCRGGDKSLHMVTRARRRRRRCVLSSGVGVAAFVSPRWVIYPTSFVRYLSIYLYPALYTLRSPCAM